MPSAVITMKSAKIRLESITLWAAMIEAPRPGAAADELAHDRADQRQHDRDAEARHDDRQGRRQLQAQQRLQPAGAAACGTARAAPDRPRPRPVSVFSISGKKQISAVITTVGVMPKPNQMMKSGPSASFGTSWLAST